MSQRASSARRTGKSKSRSQFTLKLRTQREASSQSATSDELLSVRGVKASLHERMASPKGVAAGASPSASPSSVSMSPGMSSLPLTNASPSSSQANRRLAFASPRAPTPSTELADNLNRFVLNSTPSTASSTSTSAMESPPSSRSCGKRARGGLTNPPQLDVPGGPADQTFAMDDDSDTDVDEPCAAPLTGNQDIIFINNGDTPMSASPRTRGMTSSASTPNLHRPLSSTSSPRGILKPSRFRGAHRHSISLSTHSDKRFIPSSTTRPSTASGSRASSRVLQSYRRDLFSASGMRRSASNPSPSPKHSVSMGDSSSAGYHMGVLASAGPANFPMSPPAASSGQFNSPREFAPPFLPTAAVNAEHVEVDSTEPFRPIGVSSSTSVPPMNRRSSSSMSIDFPLPVQASASYDSHCHSTADARGQPVRSSSTLPHSVSSPSLFDRRKAPSRRINTNLQGIGSPPGRDRTFLTTTASTDSPFTGPASSRSLFRGAATTPYSGHVRSLHTRPSMTPSSAVPLRRTQSDRPQSALPRSRNAKGSPMKKERKRLCVRKGRSISRTALVRRQSTGGAALTPHHQPKKTASCPLPTVEEYKCQLPLEENPKHAGDLRNVNAVSCKTVARLLEGHYDDLYDKIIIIDCRYPFEFNGGHIRGAVNVNTREELENVLFGDMTARMSGERVAVVFHCEYSQKRGPNRCREVRSRDRTLQGIKNFPKLYYPELYVMSGGYKEFHTTYTHHCAPQGYVPMVHPDHVDALAAAKRLEKSQQWKKH